MPSNKDSKPLVRARMQKTGEAYTAARANLRIVWEDGASVNAGFTSKTRSKAEVAVEHGKLPSKEAADRMKWFWSERLEALEGLLAE